MRSVDDLLLPEALELFSAAAAETAPLFDRAWETVPAWTEDDLQIDEVLYWYDGPMMFTVKTGPFKLLFQAWDEDESSFLHTVSLLDETMLGMLCDNRMSVRAAVTADLRFVADLDGMKIRRLWEVRRWNLPEASLSSPGVCLSDYEAKAPDHVVRIVRNARAAAGASSVEIRQPGFDLTVATTPEAVEELSVVVDVLRRAVTPRSEAES